MTWTSDPRRPRSPPQMSSRSGSATCRTGAGSKSSSWSRGSPARIAPSSSDACSTKVPAIVGSRLAPERPRSAAMAASGPPSASNRDAIAAIAAIRAGNEIASPRRPSTPPPPRHDSATSCTPRRTASGRPSRRAVSRPTSQRAIANSRPNLSPRMTLNTVTRAQSSGPRPRVVARKNVSTRSRRSSRVDPRRGGIHDELVTVDGRRLVGEADTPEVLEECGVEGVGRIGLGESHPAGKQGGDDAGAHRLLGRQPEAQVAEQRDAGEQVRQAKGCSGHTIVLATIVSPNDNATRDPCPPSPRRGRARGRRCAAAATGSSSFGLSPSCPRRCSRASPQRIAPGVNGGRRGSAALRAA